MSFSYNDITISEECQARIQRFRERIVFKEYLSIPVGEVMQQLRYKASAEDRLQRFLDCGKYMALDPVTGQVLKANFCKQRLCPVCNYIASCIYWHKIKKATEWIKENNRGVQFVFMTVTVRNCPGEELTKTIDNVLAGFRRLTNRRTWKESTLGMLRGLEITYKVEDDTFHPHIHMLVAVPDGYFSKKNDKYIDIEKLRAWWEESARLDYFAQVDIRRVTSEDNAIAEVAKYAVKMAEILKADSNETMERATMIIHQCIYGRRLKATTGVFKDAFKTLKLGSLEDFDIDPDISYENAIELTFSDSSAEYNMKGVKIECRKK